MIHIMDPFFGMSERSKSGRYARDGERGHCKAPLCWEKDRSGLSSLLRFRQVETLFRGLSFSCIACGPYRKDSQVYLRSRRARTVALQEKLSIKSA